MKALPGPLAAHYASGAASVAVALRITRTDAQVFGFTSADVSETIGGVLYNATPGLDVTSVEHSAGAGVDNLELSTLDDGTVFTRSEVLGGTWRNAQFLLFRYNWASPSDGIDPLLAGTVGEVELRRDTVVAELRGLQQHLQQPVSNVSTKLCRARLGDGLCRVNLAPFTFSGAVTAVASSQVFTDSTKAQAANYFAEGLLNWLTGANAGRQAKVKAFASGGVFTLDLPMLGSVVVGDTFSVIAGCTRRLVEDCQAKFSNELNFQGEPHRPTTDTLTQTPEPQV